MNGRQRNALIAALLIVALMPPTIMPYLAIIDALNPVSPPNGTLFEVSAGPMALAQGDATTTVRVAPSSFEWHSLGYYFDRLLDYIFQSAPHMMREIIGSFTQPILPPVYAASFGLDSGCTGGNSGTSVSTIAVTGISCAANDVIIVMTSNNTSSATVSR